MQKPKTTMIPTNPATDEKNAWINWFRRLDKILMIICGFTCFALVGLVFTQVVMRYVWNFNSIALQELSWHLFGGIFLLGAAITLNHDRHVRVDIFYQNFSQRKKFLVNAIGYFVLLVPSCVILMIYGFEFMINARSFIQDAIPDSANAGTKLLHTILAGERSPDPGGLPARWIIKSFVPLSAALLLIQASFSLTLQFCDVRQND